MKRHINYTQRKKIPQKNINITLIRENEMIKSFNASINLQGLELPFDAKVFIEAYYRTDRKRFDFGTVGNILEPQNSDLSDLGYLENLSFRIKIVDTSTKYGLILAEADKIKPHKEEGTEEKIQSILATEFNCELGHQIWRINFSSSPPILELNKNIPNIRSFTKSDPAFFFYVYPQVIKEILTYMFFIELFDPDESTDEWLFNWFEFAKNIYPESVPKRFNPSDPDTQLEIIEWIDKVINEFSLLEQKKWEKFEKIIDGGAGI